MTLPIYTTQKNMKHCESLTLTFSGVVTLNGINIDPINVTEYLVKSIKLQLDRGCNTESSDEARTIKATKSLDEILSSGILLEITGTPTKVFNALMDLQLVGLENAELATAKLKIEKIVKSNKVLAAKVGYLTSVCLQDLESVQAAFRTANLTVPTDLISTLTVLNPPKKVSL